MTTKSLSLAATLAILHVFVPGPRLDAGGIFGQPGISPYRAPASELPYEHIDPLTGNVLLTFTDLVLPGDAGFDLRVQRSYNSKILEGDAQLLIGDSWAGLGWTLHFGRVLAIGLTPVVEMSDGSRHEFYQANAESRFFTTNDYISKDFWRYRRNGESPANPATLELPNGVKYSFGHVVNGTQLYCSKIEDPFGNRIEITYYTDPPATAGAPEDAIKRIVQTLGSGTRTVEFTYAGALYKSLNTMTFDNRTWTYGQTSAAVVSNDRSFLTQVTPPATDAAPWVYTYDTASPVKGELLSVTTPNGGKVAYTYGEREFQIGTSSIYRTRVVLTRKTYDRGSSTALGTWNYKYPTDLGSPFDQTRVESPCGTTTTYRFLGVGSSTAVTDAWKVGLQVETTIAEGATTLEKQTLTWVASPAISPTTVIIGPNSDAGIFVPMLKTRTITRPNSGSWTTTNDYNTTSFADYGRPFAITEDGELRRKTTRAFEYAKFQPAAATRYLGDKIASEKVEPLPSGTSFTTQWTYDVKGFRLTQNAYGLTLTYVPTAAGNVQSVTDGENHATSYTYQNGVVKNTVTPAYTITRLINLDGTVQYEERASSKRTSYTYDGIGRPKTVTPPDLPPVVGPVIVRVRPVRGPWAFAERRPPEAAEA